MILRIWLIEEVSFDTYELLRAWVGKCYILLQIHMFIYGEKQVPSQLNFISRIGDFVANISQISSVFPNQHSLKDNLCACFIIFFNLSWNMEA